MNNLSRKTFALGSSFLKHLWKLTDELRPWGGSRLVQLQLSVHTKFSRFWPKWRLVMIMVCLYAMVNQLLLKSSNCQKPLYKDTVWWAKILWCCICQFFMEFFYYFSWTAICGTRIFPCFCIQFVKKISPLPSSDLGWEQKQQYSRTCFWNVKKHVLIY